jgi:hypothetical protein
VARYQAQHSPRELMAVVAAVARAARPEKPEAVSMRAWDAAREPAGYEDAPRAHSIAQGLEVPWRELVRIALDRPDDAWRQLGHAASDKGRHGVGLERVLVALRQVALARRQETLTRADYSDGRDAILAPARRAKHPDAEDGLPRLELIDNLIRRLGFDWDELLRRAGLAPSTRGLYKGLEAEPAVRLMAEDLGAVPEGLNALTRWARARGVALRGDRRTGKPDGGPMRGADVRQAIRELQRERKATGAKPLPVASAEQVRDAEKLPPISDPGVPKARVVAPRWNRERLIDGMAEAVRRLAGKQLDQRSLKEEAKLGRLQGDTTVPSYSQVYNHLRKHYKDETFAEWVAEAERRARGLSAMPSSE